MSQARGIIAEWRRVVETTIADHMRGWEDCVTRERKLLRELKKNGKLRYNASGDTFTWRVKKSQGTVQVNNGAQSVTYAPFNRYDTATLDYQGYIITDAMTKREQLKNRGVPAIIKVWDETVENMLSDLEDKFAEELYIDSSATGNSGRLSGIETMMAATQTISVATTTSTVARTANAADPVAYPNDTYAGISTKLGNEGGTWNANWPFGKGDAEFDYFSPLIVNFTSTYFDGSSTTWANNCELATRFGLVHARRNRASEGQINLVLLDAERYRQLADKHAAKERTVINQGSRDREFGFDEDYIMMEGSRITWEFGIPTAVGYGFNVKQMELASMQDRLFVPDGPDYERQSRTYRVDVDFLGQLKFKSPRNFVKWLAVA